MSPSNFTESVVEQAALAWLERRASAEAKEGLTAFLEKRQPAWVGGDAQVCAAAAQRGR